MASGYRHTVPHFEFSSLNASEDLSNFLPASPSTTIHSTRHRKVLGDSDPNIQQHTPERTPSPTTTAVNRESVKLDSVKRHRSSEPVALPRGKKILAVEPDLVPYHQYRARQRRDPGADGESVWDEELENAFMEGM